MSDAEDRWRGITPSVVRDGERFMVAFYSVGLMANRGPNGDAPQVPGSATVHLWVGQDGNPVVDNYQPPDISHPGLARADFEKRAVEEVRKAIAAGPA